MATQTKSRRKERAEPEFELHIHGDISIKADVSLQRLEEALMPILDYVNAQDFDDAVSCYDEEPGFDFDARTHVLHLCWSAEVDRDFHSRVETAFSSLNEFTAEATAVELAYYENDDDAEGENDEFGLMFVGPTPEAILEAQREYMVEEVGHLLSSQFDEGETAEVIEAVNRVFAKKSAAIESFNKIAWGQIPGMGGAGNHGAPNASHLPPGKRRHLH